MQEAADIHEEKFDGTRFPTIKQAKQVLEELNKKGPEPLEPFEGKTHANVRLIIRDVKMKIQRCFQEISQEQMYPEEENWV